MIPSDPKGESPWRIDLACELLAHGEAVAFFSEPRPAKANPQAWSRIATIWRETQSRTQGSTHLAIFPTHLFVPVSGTSSHEALIYFDTPVLSSKDLREDGEVRDRTEALAAALEARLRQSIFRLRPEDLGQFLPEVEEVLRADLEEDWASRPNWKQQVEGFGLSGFVAEWASQLNDTTPEQLIALRTSLGAYREARRLWSQRGIELALAGEWVNSSWRRRWAGIETLLGLPVAFYGVFNHLLALIFLWGAGLAKEENEKKPKLRWAIRAVVALSCYTWQTVVCAHLLGSSIAVYYAFSLPTSGAYIWRYRRLLRTKTRPLILAYRVFARAPKLRRMRKEWIKELNRSIEAYAAGGTDRSAQVSVAISAPDHA